MTVEQLDSITLDAQSKPIDLQITIVYILLGDKESLPFSPHFMFWLGKISPVVANLHPGELLGSMREAEAFIMIHLVEEEFADWQLDVLYPMLGDLGLRPNNI